MKSDEIKRVLEFCLKTNQAYKCTECRYYNKTANCLRSLMTDTVDLINRQQAEIKDITEKFNRQQTVYADLSKVIKDQKTEIDGLKSRNINNCRHWQKKYNSLRAEAIKEFAERLKDEVAYYEDTCGNFVPFVDCRDINNLVKEMVGED